MKKRQLHFPCANHSCQHLAKILDHYAHAAFPVGGSECAQATRESLLDLASRLDKSEESSFAINARQRPMLKSAINWYFSEFNNDDNVKERLLAGIERR